MVWMLICDRSLQSSSRENFLCQMILVSRQHEAKSSVSMHAIKCI